MNRIWLDILVNCMIDSSLVAAQALVLNRLGVPFAAITAIAGVASYMVALCLLGLWTWFTVMAFIGAFAIVCFALLAHPLPEDRYLLLTLAALGILRSTVATFPDLGGQIGLASASAAMTPQVPEKFVALASILFASSILLHAVSGRSEFGLAVHIARFSREDRSAAALVPVGRITTVCFVVAAMIAAGAGSLRAMYAGRVDPSVFRIQTAITFLMATLVAGSSPLRVAILSLAFFAFPDLFALVFGYNTSALAYIREMLWSLLIITLISKRPSRVSRWLSTFVSKSKSLSASGRRA